MKNVIVTLRVVRGKKITFNEDGTIANDNQPVKIKYDTIEWTNFMKYLHVNGFGRVTVEKAVQMLDDGTTREVDFTKIAKEVDKAFKGDDPEPTAEQKLEALQAQIDALKKAKDPEPIVEEEQIIEVVDAVGEVKEEAPAKEETEPKEVQVEEVDPKEAMKVARAEYRKLFGKAPGPKWTVETINEKIEAKKK